jgi:hypothetical protein
MSGRLRAGVYALFAALWLSGIAWLVLHLGFPQQTAFGPAPSPSEAVTLRVHGVLAVAGVFLLGWLSADHISLRWGRRGHRISGYVLTAAAAVLVISGYALYYTTDRLHDGAARVHEVLGVGALLLGLAHWQHWGRRVGRAFR